MFTCYSWTLLGFFNKLSSFLLYFTVAEIAEIFTLMMAFALLESLAIAGLLVVLSALLPAAWLRDGFSTRSLVVIVVFAAASLILQKTIPDDFPSTAWLLAGLLVPLGLILFLNFFIHSHPRVRDVLLSIQDRISIMLYIYIPLGLISLLLFLYRSLM